METGPDAATLDDVLDALDRLVNAVMTIAPDVGAEINGIGGSLRTTSRTR
jgi:division protein CdvB (Snf7/Vps24/ESCRT-III family)